MSASFQGRDEITAGGVSNAGRIVRRAFAFALSFKHKARGRQKRGEEGKGKGRVGWGGGSMTGESRGPSREPLIGPIPAFDESFVNPHRPQCWRHRGARTRSSSSAAQPPQPTAAETAAAAVVAASQSHGPGNHSWADKLMMKDSTFSILNEYAASAKGSTA